MRNPTAIQVFVWQDDPVERVTDVDSDWAGDRVSRKSTAGGMHCQRAPPGEELELQPARGRTVQR